MYMKPYQKYSFDDIMSLREPSLLFIFKIYVVILFKQLNNLYKI